jgi:uncharacterized protein YecE (DUF72 family)
MSAEMTHPIYVGVAGWSIPKEHAGRFPAAGTHLERYAAVFPAVEINSSFYRPHRPATYARWAASVPADFRFAVKVPREITHRHRLVEVRELLDTFLAEAGALGDKLGPLLVQLPPSLAFAAPVATSFFGMLREQYAGGAVCEPRHPSWFRPEAERLLTDYHIARVAADPAVLPAAAEPGGWNRLVYYRLHGSPRMYYSPYADEYLALLAERLKAHASRAEVWCIFDNTALAAATDTALTVLRQLKSC